MPTTILSSAAHSARPRYDFSRKLLAGLASDDAISATIFAMRWAYRISALSRASGAKNTRIKLQYYYYFAQQVYCPRLAMPLH